MSEHPIERLRAIMAQLRDPEAGCPWDLAQDFATIAPYTIEEAYEVADAIDRGAYDELQDELGDLLFQVVFHAQLAAERGHFGFDDVITSICTKMERRHPHVFGDAKVENATEQTRLWEQHKRQERGLDEDHSALAGVQAGLPEWQRSLKLQKRAAAVGFDWPEASQVLDKLREEIAEVESELATGAHPERLHDEVGDLLFVLVNLARHLDVDVSRALRGANRKFERRFRGMEALAKAKGQEFKELSLDQQEALWQQVKRAGDGTDSGSSEAKRQTQSESFHPPAAGE